MQTSPRKKSGRPAIHTEKRKPVTTQWPVDVLEYINSVTSNRTQWLVEAARQRMKRERDKITEQDRNAREYILGLAKGVKPASMPDVGEWERCCVTLTRTFDLIPEYVEGIINTLATSKKYPRLKDILAPHN